MNAPFHAEPMTLDRLERDVPARVVGIGWAELGETEANRLRHFGFDEGARVELLHQGPFGRDPLAIRIGRMTVAIRRRHALAVQVQIEAR
jgi:ferrous iron transport protein A